MDNTLFKSVDEYINRFFIPEDEALEAAARSLSQFGMPEISVSPNQGKFLQMLAQLCNAKRILEIGTLAGYSTIWMARALPEGGRLITMEYEPKHAEVAKKNIARAGLEHIVEVRVGNGLHLLPSLIAEKQEPFDMIFIDADKEPYAEYFQLSLRLSRPGTLIIADNVIREGKILDEESTDGRVKGVRRFTKMLAEASGVTATILQNVGVKEYDGMALAIVK